MTEADIDSFVLSLNGRRSGLGSAIRIGSFLDRVPESRRNYAIGLLLMIVVWSGDEGSNCPIIEDLKAKKKRLQLSN